MPCSGNDGLKVIEACEKWIEAAVVSKNPRTDGNIQILESVGDEKVLVTGATGFIGAHLIEKLVAAGNMVRVLIRNPKGLHPVFYSPLVRIIQGDITDQKTVEKAVQGIQFVYHLAHGLGQTWDDFYRLNVIPTKNLALVSLKEKVKYFVFVSSIAVYYYGDIKKGEAITGETAIDTNPQQRNLYARSKIIIENMLRNMVKGDNLPLIIFRPGIVVGRGGTLYHGGVGQWTRDNVCDYWGWGKNELPFVLVEDVADAMVRVMGLDGLEGEIFNLVGDVRLSAKEYVEYLKKYSQRDIKAFPYPIQLWYAIDVFKFIIKYLTGNTGNRNASLSYRDLANRSIHGHFDCELEKRVLSWQPCHNREEFISRAIGWTFRQEMK